MALADHLPDVDINRRRLALLIVLLLVLLGAGIGTLTGGDDPPEPGPPVVTVTPTSPTPTPTGGPGPADTPTPDSGTPTPGDGPSTPGDTPTATPTSTPPVGDGSSGSGGSDGGGDGSTPSVSLEAVGSNVVMNYGNAAPGQGDREALVLRNAGNREARLSVTNVAVQDFENGIGGAEADVDTTPNDGELSEHVMVAVEVHNPDGSVDYLYNTGNGNHRSLADLAAVGSDAEAGLLGPGEEAEVVFDWYIPTSTGNEIQSDGAEFDVSFALTADTS